MSSKVNLIGRLIRNLQWLIWLIGDYWRGRYRQVAPLSVVVLILAFVYLVIPMDLISDFIPGLGQLDDFAVLFGCLLYLEKELARYAAWRSRNPLPGRGDPNHSGKP